MNLELRLSQEKIDSYLKHKVELTVLKSVDSTNSYAIKMANGQISTNKVCLTVSDTQTGGRGRLGRSFLSKEGLGLYMTLSCCPKFPIEKAVLVTPLISLAVKNAVKDILNIDLGIKWVNDLILDSKKVGGILVEAVPFGKASALHDDKINSSHSDKTSCITGNNSSYLLVMGIGLNCFKQEFGDDLNDIAIALENTKDLGQCEYVRENLCANITDRVLDYICELEVAFPISSQISSQAIAFDASQDSFEATSPEALHIILAHMKEYREASILIGKEVNVINKAISADPVPAQVLDIDDNGALVVRLLESGEIVTLSTGEVSVRLKQ